MWEFASLRFLSLRHIWCSTIYLFYYRHHPEKMDVIFSYIIKNITTPIREKWSNFVTPPSLWNQTFFLLSFVFQQGNQKGLWESGRSCFHGNAPTCPPIPADLNLLTENLDFQEVIRSRSTHLPRNCLLSENGRNTNREKKRQYI